MEKNVGEKCSLLQRLDWRKQLCKESLTEPECNNLDPGLGIPLKRCINLTILTFGKCSGRYFVLIFLLPVMYRRGKF